jgi:DNA polymerase IV
MTRAILHVDMDAFFASVEVLDNPALRGKPVIVGGSVEGRGVVSAASYEARKFGVHSAMSAARARQKCPDGVFLPVRMQRYAAVSAQIFEIFEGFTDLVEGLSIDEAFLDVTGSQRLFGPAEQIAGQIKQRVREELGLICSVGLATNKFLAKVASDLEKPDGLVVVRPGEEAAFMAPLPVRRIWGIGKVSGQRLANMGIEKVTDLLKYPVAALESALGSGAEHLLQLARGIDDRAITTGRGQKSIGAETTFAQDIAAADELRRVLDGLVERVAGELRAAGLLARTVNIKARYPDFTTVTRARTLSGGIASTRQIRDTARELLETRLMRAGRPLRLLGVSLSNLEKERESLQQTELFADVGDARREQLERAIDGIKHDFGDASLMPGSQVEAQETDEDD